MAYEPCKEYFKEKKAKLRFNLQQRKEICSQLEQLIEDIDTSSLHISNLTRIENKATSEWKTYAPVEQSKIRSIQKRFNEVLGKIRTLRRKASHTNADAKKALIEQAIKLSENEDLRQSMDKAKDLQKQWKTIGPSNYKADQKYWNSFRNACDKIFKKRDEQAQAQRDADKHAVTEARSFLEQMENSLSVKDEDFSDVRKVFRKIQDQCTKKSASTTGCVE